MSGTSDEQKEPSFKAGAEFRNVYNPEIVHQLALRLKKEYSKFDINGFVDDFTIQYKPLKLMERSHLITKNLIHYLPQDFKHSVDVLLNILGPELDKTSLTGFEGFIVVPQTMFIVERGMDEQHFLLSMKALYEMTKRFSSENAMRFFLLKHEKKTLEILHVWVNDPNVHVRRLVSECTRPRLPWACRLLNYQKNPQPVLELLEKLKFDNELYVRRSVANNLNDITKDNPDIVVEVLKRWSKTNDKGVLWLVKHAARSMLKQGHKEVLQLLGYQHPELVFENFVVDNKIILGYDLKFSFDILSRINQNVMIDYKIYFMKANGKLSPKVFKLSKKKLKKGEKTSFSKKHSFRLITTRKYYRGEHTLEIIVNGIIFGKKHFLLI